MAPGMPKSWPSLHSQLVAFFAGRFGPIVVQVADRGELRAVVAESGPRVKMVLRVEAAPDHRDPCALPFGHPALQNGMTIYMRIVSY